MPWWLTLLFATACGLIVANLYYAQPLVGLISADLGMSPKAAGLVVTLTQIGYGAGLLLIVPLGDLFENRRLTVTLLSVHTLALVALTQVTHALPYLGIALLIGLTAVTVQVLVPYAANMASDATRGKVVGNVTSGLMVGIMLARPVSSFLTDLWGWHAVFMVSAVLMAALVLVLRRALPVRRPAAGLRYGAMLRSMGRLAVETPVLRRRALYQACIFGAFSLFWTVTPLLLASPAYGLSQKGIALFALVGVAGAVAAPMAGRWADKGHTRLASGLSMAAIALAFAMTWLAPVGSVFSLGLLVVAAVLLDFGASANLVLGQRVIFALNPQSISRLNGLFMAMFYLGGAAGSAIGGWSYAHGGWGLSSAIGIALAVAALLYFATERKAPAAA
jgi:predicted MFS family arabinose efflux permease